MMTTSQYLANHLGQPGDQVFQIRLQNVSPLNEATVVRIVPDKRYVCRASWQGQAVFAKIFVGEKAEAYAERDQRGVGHLIAANIPTPQLLGVAKLAGGHGVVLIFKAVQDSEDAESAYNRGDEKVREQLMHASVKAVATHHRANLIQTDLYLKNFLIAGDLAGDFLLHTLDGDGIRHFEKLSADKAKQNLAILLSKFDPIALRQHGEALLNTYHAIAPYEKFDLSQLIHLATQHAIDAASRYADKKVFRSCTDVRVEKHNAYFSAITNNTGDVVLPMAVKAYDDLLASGALLKQGNTCTVGRVSISHVECVIKRYNIKNVWHGLSRLFRRTRASISWANAHRLQLLGIPTPKPIALFESKIGGCLNGKAYFVSEYVDAPDVGEHFAQAPDSAEQEKVIDQMVTMFYRLYLLKLSHGDMKATNIKVLSDGKAMLIDLDSMRQHRKQFDADKAHARDLKRFMQNWKAQPALYNAFVGAFRQVYADHEVLYSAGIL